MNVTTAFDTSTWPAIAVLNQKFSPLVVAQQPVSFDVPVRVQSKSKFDRFDLHSHLEASVLDFEDWFQHELRARDNSAKQFNSYNQDFELIGYKWLGNSSHPDIPEARFFSIDRKRFHRVKLSKPMPHARLTATVTYTSSKGQSSYSRALTWDFHQLVAAFPAAQASRARMSTAQAMRQRERNLVTDKIRMTNLQTLCQACNYGKSNRFVG